jgi:ABC-2 type transport system permease protein
MNAAWVIALKDLRQLMRDRMACFFALVFPLLISVLFGTIFAGSGGGGDGEARKMAVLLVDEDQTDGSRTFAKTLRESSELEVTESPSRDEASNAVRNGNSAACIVLPKGFGKTRENMFWGAGSSVALGVDPSRRAEAGMLEGILTKYGFSQMQEGFKDPSKMRQQVQSSLDQLKKSSGASPLTKRVFERFYGDLDNFLAVLPEVQKQDEADAPAKTNTGEPTVDKSDDGGGGMGGWQPLKIEKLEIAPKTRTGPPNPFSITFPQGIIWGVMGCALGFSIGLVLERTRGTMMRLRVAPLSQAQILGGKALACFLATIGVSWLVLLVGVAAFGIRPNSWPLLAIATISTAVCFVGIMMLLAVFGKSERGGNSLGWGVLLMFSMIGGGMIPLFFMPGWMQTASVVSPIRWAILALEGAIWRGFTPLEMLKPCLILTVIGVVGFVVGSRAMGRAES